MKQNNDENSSGFRDVSEENDMKNLIKGAVLAATKFKLLSSILCGTVYCVVQHCSKFKSVDETLVCDH